MQILAFIFLLLIALDNSYCTHTSSSNKSSAVWGYEYSENNNKVYNVKHDDDGYRLQPISNDTNTDYKHHYNSWSAADIFTSPETSTNDTQTSSTEDLFNSTQNSTSDDAALESTIGFRAGPTSNAHAVNVQDIQLGIPTVPETPSQRTMPWLHTPVGVQPGVPSNGLRQTTIILPRYDSQFTSPFSIPTGPLYFTSYSSMYGPPAGSNYGIPNDPTFWPQNGQMFVPQTDPMNGYRPQYSQSSDGPLTGPMDGHRPQYGLNNIQSTGPLGGYGLQISQSYEPLTGPMGGYRPQNVQNNVPPTGPLGGFGPQTGQTFGSLTRPIDGYRPQNRQNNVPPTGPSGGYGPQTGHTTYGPPGPMDGFRPQNGPNNMPPTGPMDEYGPQNGQTYSPHVIYPTKSWKVSHRYNY